MRMSGLDTRGLARIALLNPWIRARRVARGLRGVGARGLRRLLRRLLVGLLGRLLVGLRRCRSAK